jgi:shikimate kinase/3-dehydroquinate synthase
MDVVLVGLPGSGKTEVGRRLAAAHRAAFVDLDAEIEREVGSTIAELFALEGEAAFRARERATVERLGPPDPSPAVSRVVAAGGGAVVDPRNRWRLLRGRVAVWLDAPTPILASRLGDAAGTDRPLLAGDDVLAALDQLAAARAPYYAACPRVDAGGAPDRVARLVTAAVEEAIRAAAAGEGRTTLLRVVDPAGRFVLGEGIAAAAIDAELRAVDAGRAILLSEPGAWAAAGGAIGASLRDRGWPAETVLLPPGEDAKRLAVVEDVAGRLARLGLERDEPLVAIGGGALTDAAGFVAATYARGVPWIAVPTTLVGQIDAALGGKTAVDLAAGKNLVGAFHRPAAVIADIGFLASLPERQRRAALGEAVKAAVLGDERLLEVLEADGPAIATGEPAATESGALAEVVERCARLKLDVVAGDPQEHGERVALNLGHTLGHAIEVATGFRDVLHGEAVAYGLRAACRLGVARGTLPAGRADRIERLLDALRLGAAPVPGTAAAVTAALGVDKKRRAGRLRWVLPTETGWTLDDAIPDDMVASVAAAVLDGRPAGHPARPTAVEVAR